MRSKLGLLTTCALVASMVTGVAFAQTVRIAEHRQARIDALAKVIPAMEAKTGLTIEIVEYPGPDREYMAKLLTELRAGAGPDVYSLPGIGDIAEFTAAGYLVPVTQEIKSWDGYDQLYDVVKELSVSDDGNIYVMPSIVSVQQLYYRKDILEQAGVSTDQPQNWDELIAWAIEAKEKTGQKSLLLPMGVTWGGGAFGEGFLYLLVGSSDPQLVTDDGKLNLTSKGVGEVFEFYEALVVNELLPVDPLLAPEPWVIPKYEMFPAGELLATTCGAWCYIFDWGPESNNPIPNVTEAVGTWTVPGKEGGQHVIVGIGHPWAVSSNAANVEASKQVLLEMGSVATGVSYSQKQGSLPARKDALDDPDFQKLTALIPILGNLKDGRFVKGAEGFSAVAEGVARATEALLLETTDAAGAQQILVDYVRNTLGEDRVQ